MVDVPLADMLDAPFQSRLPRTSDPNLESRLQSSSEELSRDRIHGSADGLAELTGDWTRQIAVAGSRHASRGGERVEVPACLANRPSERAGQVAGRGVEHDSDEQLRGGPVVPPSAHVEPSTRQIKDG